MMTEMFASEEPCEIIMTFTSRRASASKIIRATPGRPIICAPLMLTRATFSIRAMALTTRFSRCSLRRMSVPGHSGLKVFLTRIGISFCIAGSTERGWSTLAPK